MPPDYKKGQIYKLINDELCLTYYGSTIQPLHKRLHAHKTALRKCSSEILFTEGKCKIYLVEEYPCDNKRQLEQRERYYIENNNCVNKNIPCRTIKEYTEENKDKLKDKFKEYYEKNKDKILEKQKEKINCQCGSIIRRSDMARHKKTKKHINFSL